MCTGTLVNYVQTLREGVASAVVQGMRGGAQQPAVRAAVARAPDARDDGRRAARRHRGRAVQIVPMKPMLIAPGTKRSKLLCDEPPSSFAFVFNLHRYIEAGRSHSVGTLVEAAVFLVHEGSAEGPAAVAEVGGRAK